VACAWIKTVRVLPDWNSRCDELDHFDAKRSRIFPVPLVSADEAAVASSLETL
jgi:hypothetical protein